ncbi:hypothetical protein [Comamonas sp. JC664]|uniref:hypothetical protein n=1 Tax=Comamonas sp. JC664 TaxID=2801917 RepID=UPI00361993A2
MILITHEMSVIREIADQVLVLEKGRLPSWATSGRCLQPAPCRHPGPAGTAASRRAR